ncbi:MAG TPA: class II aldolase/adducin family protein [Candidatus Lokiarchaeia archaeon]|nr:class II aldolase/adducin family protein [Candidatus Lokiarchaeia archaeon]
MVNETDLVTLRMEIVRASRAIISKKLVEIGEGNISARIPDSDEFFVTPTYNNYENMNPMDVVHMNVDGTIISCPEGRKPSSEWRLHATIYKNRPRVNFTIHTHSPYATMMAILGEKIPPLLEEMVVFIGGEIPVVPFGRANTFDLAEKVVASMGAYNAALMANHGPVAVGRTMDKAIKNAELTEKMAFLYYGASQRGTPNILDDPDDLAFFKDIFEAEHATY